MNTPLLSYVIATRNDNFCGNNMQRLNQTIEFIRTNDPESEILIVDWGSEQQVYEDLWFRGVDGPRVIRVTPHIASKYPTPFHETLALNIGIRRARGTWIGRLDQDTFPDKRFVEWFGQNHCYAAGADVPPDSTAPAWFSMRQDLPEGSLDTTKAALWGSQHGWTEDRPDYFRAAIGIILATREAWHFTRGYNEQLMFRNHMEHDLCIRLAKTCGLMNLSPILNSPFYHQWHPRCTGRQDNPMPTLDDYKATGTQANDSNWGLGSTQLEEVVL